MNASVVICGAGISGIAAAYHLSVLRGMPGVMLVDERAPLTLTSDKSTECYRNWWAGPDGAMVALMNRSIDLLEALALESDNAIRLNRRGYLYATGDAAQLSALESEARLAAEQGAGELRIHDSASRSRYVAAPEDGWENLPTGADLLTDPDLIRKHFPALTDDTLAVLHARRCGWLSAQQLGMAMLERAREAGVELVRGRLEAVDTAGGRVSGVRVAESGGTRTIATPCFVNAAGPFLAAVAHLLDESLPVYSEPHLKISFNDSKLAIPRDSPMLIWLDPQRLDWAPAERSELASKGDLGALLGEMPPGPHCRPEGGAGSQTVLALWTYHTEELDVPRYPLPEPAHYAEVTLRGMSAMVPALRGYLERLPRAVVDGGYYTKTRENRPLCGPMDTEGAYVCGAVSGFGVMSSPAMGDLLAAHVTGAPLPDYAAAFLPSRYEDAAYVAAVEQWSATGQL